MLDHDEILELIQRTRMEMIKRQEGADRRALAELLYDLNEARRYLEDGMSDEAFEAMREAYWYFRAYMDERRIAA